MKKKVARVISILLILVLSCTVFSFAHSGRTDSNGGHRDNKNVSGLGYYHYHCGGHPAHLHPNGVCPYSGSSDVYKRQLFVSPDFLYLVFHFVVSSPLSYT